MMANRSTIRLCGAVALVTVLASPAFAAGDTTPAPRPSAIGSYLAGRFAQGQDDWNAAARYITDALSADPDEPSLVLRAMVLQLGDGRVAEALPLARKLGTLRTPSFVATALLAVDALAMGDARKAETIARDMPQDGMSRFVGPLMMAWLAAAQGDADRALKELAPIGEVEGLRPLHDLHAGAILDVTGRTERAGPFYTSAATGDAALRTVQIAGSYHRRTGHPELAEKLYKDFQTRMPDTALIDATLRSFAEGKPAQPVIGDAKQGLAEALYDLASAIQHDGAADSATLLARLALHLHPQLAPARVLVGEILQEGLRFEDAIATYRMIEADPDFGWSIRVHIADCLVDLKRNDEARTLLTQLIEERPDQTAAAIRLGDMLRTDKKWSESAAAYNRAIDRIKTPEMRHWGLYYARAIALDNAKDWPKAEADLQFALKLRPGEPSLLNYLGYSWVDRGLKLDEARAMIERAVAARPDDGYIVDSLGWALYRMGDHRGAVEKLERAVELKAMDATINDHLGDAYWRVGRLAEARFQWERALKASEDEAEKARIEAKLKDGLTGATPAGASPAGTPPAP
jgi:tetratricopeptide (TPR) repeat protein